MKRLLCFLTALILCLSLCACGPSKDPDPDPVPGGNDPPVDGPGSEKTLDKALLEEFYARVRGVWIRHEGPSDSYSFLAVSKDSGEICFTCGIPESEFMFGGPIDYIEKSGQKYNFNVHVPAVASTEEYSGHEAYDLWATVDCTDLSSYEITATDHARDGAPGKFVFYCDDFATLDWGALHAGNDPIPELDRDLASKLWNQVSGIWLLDQSSEGYFFSTFSEENGEFCITQGIPASGYMISGTLTEISESGGIYDLTIHVPAVPENEMDSGHDAFYASLVCEVTGNGKMNLTLFAGEGEYLSWRYASPDWDSFDWGLIYGSDVGSAWNRLSGAWVGKNESGTTLCAYFYTNGSGERVVSLSVPFTGPGTDGTVTSFEDRMSDSTWWAQLDISGSDMGILIMIDYSAISSGRIRITDFFEDGKVFSLDYKAEDPQHLTEEMMP